MIVIRIGGTRAAFEAAALPSMPGVYYSDHHATPLDNDQWELVTYVADQSVADQIAAKGLDVAVLQTADQIQATRQKVKAGIGDGGGML